MVSFCRIFLSFDPPTIFSVLCFLMSTSEGIRYKFSNTFIGSMLFSPSKIWVVEVFNSEVLFWLRYVDTFPWGSVSIISVFKPFLESTLARLITVVVLPTPHLTNYSNCFHLTFITSMCLISSLLILKFSCFTWNSFES